MGTRVHACIVYARTYIDMYEREGVGGDGEKVHIHVRTVSKETYFSVKRDLLQSTYTYAHTEGEIRRMQHSKCNMVGDEAPGADPPPAEHQYCSLSSR
jgi:hypothetical protein